MHNSFLIPKDFPDEVNGDINECDFFLGGGGGGGYCIMSIRKFGIAQ